MKPILYLIIAFLMITTASALEMCDSYPEIRTNCTMVTPKIECSIYNYTIYNTNSTVANSGNMTLFTTGIYSFNFTEGKGDYLIELCDGTTREVFVREEANTKMFLIIGLVGIGLLYALLIHFITSGHNEDKHSPLKILFSIVTLTLIIILSSFMNHAGSDEAISSNLQRTLEINYGLAMWTLVIFGMYLFIFLLFTLLTWITGKDYILILRDKFKEKDD